MTKKTEGTVITSYEYDIEDRMVAVWNGEVGSGTKVADYYYDPMGRRLWKKLYEADGTAVQDQIYFHYSDDGLIGEYQWDSGNSQVVERKTYGYKPSSKWGTDPLFMREDADSDGTADYYFYHNDHLGTPQQMTNVNGAVVWSVIYSSFGHTQGIQTSTNVNNLRFPGQYYDNETGLHFNWRRYYDPVTGRYQRVDPVGLRSGINLFTYVLNNPSNYFDPKGLETTMVDSMQYFLNGKVPKEIPSLDPDYNKTKRRIPDPESQMGKCLAKINEELKEVMNLTTAVQAGCLLKGAALCAVVSSCTGETAFGACMAVALKRCGIVANVPRIPPILQYIKRRAECLKLPGSYIEAD